MTDRSCPVTSLEKLRLLRDWCKQPLGQQLAETEQAVLREVLSDVFGYHLVVLDPSCQPDSLGASRIRIVPPSRIDWRALINRFNSTR